MQLYFIISFWRALRNKRIQNPMIFVNLIDIFIFWFFRMVWRKKLRVSGLLWLHSPYCKNWNPRYPSNMSECLQFPWIPLRYPPDIPKIPPRHLQGTQDINRRQQMTTDANRHQQTPTDTLRHWQVLFEYVWRCLLAHVVVCWHLEFPGDVWGLFRGCLGGVWGYMSGIHGN